MVSKRNRRIKVEMSTKLGLRCIYTHKNCSIEKQQYWELYLPWQIEHFCKNVLRYSSMLLYCYRCQSTPLTLERTQSDKGTLGNITTMYFNSPLCYCIATNAKAWSLCHWRDLKVTYAKAIFTLAPWALLQKCI
jgi:hypothetical protein